MNTKKFSIGKFIIVVVSILVVLAGAYYGFFLYSKQYALASYERLNCAESASSSQQLTRYFPEFLTKNVIDHDFLQECQSFEEATALFAQENWEQAYDSYQQHLWQYPEGHFTGTAQRDAQKAIYEWALILQNQGDYETAIEKFDAILSESVIFVDADVTKAKLDSLLAWAKELRTAKAYDQAIRKIEQIKSVAQDAYLEITGEAQVELASNYLDWGKDWLAEKDYGAAKEKLTQAMQLDPNPKAASSPAQQAKAAIADMYFQLAEEAFAGKGYDSALENYRKSNEFADVADDPKLQQAIANVYIARSGDYVAQDDFLGAIDVLEKSTQTDKIDDAKNLIDAAEQKIYTAFSTSIHYQARNAMKDAANATCSGNKPSFPIFGLDPDQKYVFLSGGQEQGISGSLPESLGATIPANMAYVACINLSFEIDASSYSGISASRSMTLKTPIWDVSLRLVDTGEVLFEKTFKGTPPTISYDNCTQSYLSGSGSINFYVVCVGDYPDFSELVAWITEAIK